ncbi:MAG: BlaI/MecI/CopY family transcriptional regulator [Acidobacteriaceae bacterium]|nr:BlaI/MecI/CopY family transcriptional regulator [Acidobacteriaceae bacterium]
MALRSPLSQLEQEVMNAIWSCGKATASDVQTALLPKRVLKDSTVRTLLTRLEEKGYLQHEVDGRAFVYSSTEPPRSLAVRAVKQIVDRFCEGSFESLLVGMVDDEIVDSDELQRIVDRLAAQNQPGAASRKKRRAKPK